MKTANQILNQLGGNKFIAMTGAACYSDNNKLIVKFKGSQIANICEISLNALDLYDIKFSKFRGMNVKIVKTFENVYNDMLQNIFEQTTKLYIRL